MCGEKQPFLHTYKSAIKCSVCSFVCLMKRKFLENVHIVLFCLIAKDVRF